jgi:outer membrane protein assembly factor BamB
MNDKIKLAKRIAWAAGAFSLIVAVLLIANFLQTKFNDPIDNKTIPELVKRLSENPSDEALKQEIRAFDLMARKAYFTSQWQIRTGGYLLLLGVIITLLAVRYERSTKSKLDEVDILKDESALDKVLAQKWIAALGVFIFLAAIVSGILSYNALDRYLVVVENAPAVSEAGTTASSGENALDNMDQPSSGQLAAGDTVTANVVTETPSSSSLAEAVAENAATKTFATMAEMKANYPFFRGPEGIGIAYQKNIPTDWNGTSGENILWKVKVPKPGYSSPIIWGNKLFVTGADASARVVYCYDKNTGKLIWEASADQIEGSPSKMPKVTADTGLAAPTMATDGYSVFAIFATGDVLALDMNGKRTWAKNLGVPDNHYGHASSLVVYKDKLLIQYDTNKGGKVMALSTASGEKIWETVRGSKISWASPALVNTGTRTELVLATNPTVASYDPETGKELWSMNCLSGEVGPSVAYSNGMFYAANEYAKLAAIKPGSAPSIVWSEDEYLPEVASPLAVNSLVFVATTYGVLACYDAQTGEKYWEQEWGDPFYASPVYADGNVYLADQSGKMHIVKASKTFELVAEPTIGEKVVCSPVFGDGRLYLRGTNQLYCIGTK